MNTKATPGPWKFDPEYLIVSASDGSIVARVTQSTFGRERTLANGRLLVAAPELRDALAECVEALDRQLTGAGSAELNRIALERARAALAKVEGK